MPVVRDIKIPLGVEQVLSRRKSTYQSRVAPQLMATLSELLPTVGELVEPVFVYEIYPVSNVGDKEIVLDNGTVFHSTAIPQFLSGAKELAVVVSTIGPRLEEKTSAYFAANEPLRGLVLDDIGNAALSSLSIEICQFMEKQAVTRGYHASGRLSPGELDWPIQEQHPLFELIPAADIGVRLTTSGMMAPRKSNSMVIGLGQQMETWTKGEVCSRCRLSQTCAYRFISG
jgi:hypothetical protein